MDIKYYELPDWAKEMSDEEWEEYKKEELSCAFNCDVCGERIFLILCNPSEPKHYCYNHCPQHLWQTECDYPVECARCGVIYTSYLEDVLKKHNISFNDKHWKGYPT